MGSGVFSRLTMVPARDAISFQMLPVGRGKSFETTIIRIIYAIL